jgi:hypothetical protein
MTSTTKKSAEPALTRLVQDAPVLDPAIVADALAALATHGAPLAASIARVLALVAVGAIDPGISLPHLAMACATLDTASDPQVLAAAQYEIETLLPVPSRAPRSSAPDVSIESLRKAGAGKRSATGTPAARGPRLPSDGDDEL